MSITETRPEIVAPKLGYGISDADQHFYEAPDSFTRYLEPEFKNSFRWVEMDGRKKLLLNDKLYTLLPNPTFDPVASPGSMVEYFRGRNPEGKSVRELCGPMQALEPSFRYREPRMKVLDEQGVDLCIMLPTQVLGLEVMMWEDPGSVVACVRSLNRWMHEEWTWNTDDRVFVTGIITLIDPVEAEKELETLIEQGCKVIGMRPGPVSIPGYNYSIGDPMYDRFWARCAEAGIIVGFHAADTSYSSQQAIWGETGKVGWKQTPLAEIMAVHTERPIFDTMAAMIGHGVFDRHPDLKVAVLELGTGWIHELFRRMKIAYAKMPQTFAQDPIQSFIDHVWVMPFAEDDVAELVKELPIENVIYGSDWPHPEGLADPEEYVLDLPTFTPAEQKMIMRDNLRKLAGFPV